MDSIQEIVQFLKEHHAVSRLSNDATVKDLAKEIANIRELLTDLRLQVAELKSRVLFISAAVSTGIAILFKFLLDKLSHP